MTDATVLADGDIWRTLGIAPTLDRREIRLAYSSKLKAMDPDLDPEAFIALRHAFDAANVRCWHAERAAAETQAPDAANNPASDAEAPAQDLADGPAIADPDVPATSDSAPTDSGPATIDAVFFSDIETALSQSPGDPEVLVQATWRLLRHPAMDHINTGQLVENWIARTIVDWAPRSDPMLDPVIEHFGWERMAGDWRAPPVVNWLLARQNDRNFEHWLFANYPRYREIVSLLRDQEPPSAGERPSLGRDADMRAFLIYARANHATTLALCRADSLRWWETEVLGPGGWRRDNLRALHRIWRGQDDEDALFWPRPRTVSPRFALGVLVLPWIFVWPLLRHGYSWLARGAALAWLALSSFLLWTNPSQPPRYGSTVAAPSLYDAAVPPRPPSSFYVDPATDIDPLLGQLRRQGFTLAVLRQRNPELSGQLTERWTEARDTNEARTTFDQGIFDIINEAFSANLRGASFETQARYWRLDVDRLRWLRSGGGDGCDRFVRGEHVLMHPVFRTNMNNLIADILVSPSPRRPPRSAGTTFTVPDSLVRQTAARAGIAPRDMEEAMLQRSSPRRNCDVRIALLETILAAPRARAAPIVRDMTLGLR